MTDIVFSVLEQKITVIPNAVNIEQFEFDQSKDSALANELGLNGEVVVGFIGSFYAYEGIDLLVRAAAQIKSPVKLLLVGGGNEKQKISDLVEQLNLQDKVIMTGRVPHTQVAKYYDLVDIFVYPRKSMRLTELVTPLKPLEAMAKGRLVIASDVGGHRELIEHNKTGFLFSADNIDALSNTIDQVIEQSEQWQEFKKNGRHFVEHERNWRTSVANYQSVYESLVS